RRFTDSSTVRNDIMAPQSRRIILLTLGAAVLSLAAWRHSAGRSLAQDAKDDPWKDLKYSGADTCKRCHATPGADPTDFCRLDEYTIWRTRDRHSLAYAVLKGPRGQRMGELLGGDKDFVLSEKAGCLSCHAMSFPGREGDQFHVEDGVSCD